MKVAVEALELPLHARCIDVATIGRRRFGLGPIATIDRRTHRFGLRMQRAMLGLPLEGALLLTLVRGGRAPLTTSLRVLGA